MRSSDVSKTVTIGRIATLSEQVDASLKSEWLMARLSGTVGAAGAFLAALGIYGLMAFTMARRTGEIALRMALGATRRDAVLLIMKGGVQLAAAGVVIGVPLAIYGTRVAAQLHPADRREVRGVCSLHRGHGHRRHRRRLCPRPPRRACRTDAGLRHD